MSSGFPLSSLTKATQVLPTHVPCYGVPAVGEGEGGCGKQLVNGKDWESPLLSAEQNCRAKGYPNYLTSWRHLAFEHQVGKTSEQSRNMIKMLNILLCLGLFLAEAPRGQWVQWHSSLVTFSHQQVSSTMGWALGP